jgi:tetratricopeptide (TPR) repeat protein
VTASDAAPFATFDRSARNAAPGTTVSAGMQRFVVLVGVLVVGSVSAYGAPRELDAARRLNLEGRYEEARQKLAAAAANARTPCERADVLIQAAITAVEEMSFRGPASGTPLQRAEEAVREARACNDRWKLARAVTVQGRAHYARTFAGMEPDFELARARYAESLELRSGAPPGDRAQSLFHLGLVHEQKEELKQAEAAYREAHVLATEARDLLLLSYLERHLASFERATRGMEGELARHRESLRLREQLSFFPGIVFARLAIGDTLLAMGRPIDARAAWEQALKEAGAYGVRRGVVVSASKLASAAAERGDAGRARELYALAAAVAREMGDAAAEAEAKRAMAAVVG